MLVASACASSSDPSDVARDADEPAASADVAEPSPVRDERSPAEASPAVKVPGRTVARKSQRPAAEVRADGPVVTRTSRGVNATTINVGIRYAKNVDEASQFLGIETVELGDTRAMGEAVVKHLNARGGIAGRRIKPYYAAWDAANVTDYGAEDQKNCTYFTEDAIVFAVVTAIPTGSSPKLPECLSKDRVPLVHAFPDWWFDRTVMASLAGYFYLPGNPNTTRLAKIYADNLVRRKFFGSGARIGLLLRDTTFHRRAANEGLKPALRAHRLRIDEEAFISQPQHYSSAVLAFRTAGITHVLFLDNGLSSVLFMNQAESQGYRPRYGFTTMSNPSQLLVQNAPKAQLERSLGVGWMPHIDVDAAHDPPASAERKACLDIYRKAGVPLESRGAQGSALFTCDVLFMLKKAVEGSSSFTPEAVRRSVDGMGTSFRPAATFGARFGPNRYDAMSLVRDFAFDSRCGCFPYIGAPRPAD